MKYKGLEILKTANGFAITDELFAVYVEKFDRIEEAKRFIDEIWG